MDTTGQAQGYGKFEETAHELEQAAAAKAYTARRAGASGMAALAATVRARPVAAVLVACAAGYALGWLRRA